MWNDHNANTIPAALTGNERIDIRTRDGFEISHSRADYPHWAQTGGRNDIVAWRAV